MIADTAFRGACEFSFGDGPRDDNFQAVGISETESRMRLQLFIQEFLRLEGFSLPVVWLAPDIGVQSGRLSRVDLPLSLEKLKHLLDHRSEAQNKGFNISWAIARKLRTRAFK
eukprot:g59186.t1